MMSAALARSARRQQRHLDMIVRNDRIRALACAGRDLGDTAPKPIAARITSAASRRGASNLQRREPSEMSENREWQRKTALSRIDRLREEQTGAPIPDRHLAAKAAQYVGGTADQVLAWMRGAK